MMNERERNWLNQLFVNNHNIMRNARQDVENIKRELMIYQTHEIDYDLLIVDYVVGNKEEFGTKEFDLQKFYAWVADNADKKDWMIWVDLDKDDVGGTNGMQEVFNIEGYVEANEEMLVKEYFSKFK